MGRMCIAKHALSECDAKHLDPNVVESCHHACVRLHNYVTSKSEVPPKRTENTMKRRTNREHRSAESFKRSRTNTSAKKNDMRSDKKEKKGNNRAGNDGSQSEQKKETSDITILEFHLEFAKDRLNIAQNGLECAKDQGQSNLIIAAYEEQIELDKQDVKSAQEKLEEATA